MMRKECIHDAQSLIVIFVVHHAVLHGLSVGDEGYDHILSLRRGLESVVLALHPQFLDLGIGKF